MFKALTLFLWDDAFYGIFHIYYYILPVQQFSTAMRSVSLALLPDPVTCSYYFSINAPTLCQQLLCSQIARLYEQSLQSVNVFNFVFLLFCSMITLIPLIKPSAPTRVCKDTGNIRKHWHIWKGDVAHIRKKSPHPSPLLDNLNFINQSTTVSVCSVPFHPWASTAEIHSFPN